MPYLAFQTFLLLASAYLAGAIVGYILRGIVSRSPEKTSAGAANSGGTAQDNSDDVSKPEVSEKSDTVQAAIQPVDAVITKQVADVSGADASIAETTTSKEQEKVKEASEAALEEVAAVQEVVEDVKEEPKVIEAPEAPETSEKEDLSIEQAVEVESIETVEEPVNQVVEVAETPDTVEVAEAVEVEQVSDVVETPVLVESVVQPDNAQDNNLAYENNQTTNGSSLLSTSNKGRVIGRQEEFEDEFDLEDLSESEFARLSKDRPVSKSNVVPTRSKQPDDLKQIKGIGIIAETQLNGLGVKSYKQIAGWNDGDIDTMETKLNTGGRIRDEKWVEQAKRLTDTKG